MFISLNKLSKFYQHESCVLWDLAFSHLQSKIKIEVQCYWNPWDTGARGGEREDSRGDQPGQMR